MKFSEAIMLGSTVIKLNPYRWLMCGKGCLCGMAYFAATGNKEGDYAEIIAMWPWLSNDVKYKGQQESYISAVSRLAHDVDDREITLEQAVDWVRKHEPKTVKRVAKVKASRKHKELVEV